ncbi:MAG: HD domain-containing protein, partial [Gaiellaceae bacterium]
MITPVLRRRSFLHLGAEVARSGRVPPDRVASAVRTVRRLRTAADEAGVDLVVALATAALRDAANGTGLLVRLERVLGHPVTLLSGDEEARLCFLGQRAGVWVGREPVLALDLGGGSLEVMLGDIAGLKYAASAKLGVGRLTTMFMKTDPPTKSELEKANEHISDELKSILSELSEFEPKLLVGSSGTFIAIATIASSLRDGRMPEHINHLTVSFEDIVTASRLVLSKRRSDRAKLPGADARRSELLPAGFLVLMHIMEKLAVSEITISGWALREGLILKAMAEHDPTEFGDDPRSIRRSSALSLCRRCNWNREHGFRVADLATILFDATSSLHRLDDRDRELLEFSALMHDVGEHISRTNHDRHGAYLIENADLRGFTPV